jgi:suppressor for copper-sensitivity B
MHYSRLLSLLTALFLVILISTKSFAQGYGERFTLESHNNKLYLQIKLANEHKIYGPVAGDSGLPTTINFDESDNLAKAEVSWPESKPEEYIPGVVNYVYSENVKIPLYIKAIDPDKQVVLKVNLSYVICGDQCVPVKQTIENTSLPGETSDEAIQINDGILLTLCAAFIGGLILNFMPCVLPVLALKLMSVIKGGAAYRRSFFVTILGIMSAFWALALASILAKSAGKQIGIGMGFQESEFIIFLCVLITVFISISLDKVQINFYSSGLIQGSPEPSKALASGARETYLQDFLSGVIATLLSIPCTAPFLGGATLIAVSGTARESLAIFTSIGLGFSLPYLLLILSPNMLRFLPKPGAWMENMKKILAILFVASLVWLLGVLYDQLGLRASAGLFLLLLLIKFALEEPKLPYKAICIIALVAASLYLPQFAHDEDEEDEIYIEHVWHKFDRQKIDELVMDGKIVVVDVTADWCLTCKYNKFMVWDRKKTVKLLLQKDIVAMRADVTKQDEVVEDYLKEHGVYGIPFDVVYSKKTPKGLALPTLLRYQDLVEAIDATR